VGFDLFSIVLSLSTLYLFIKTSFPLETINSDPLNGGKPDRKPYHPNGCRNPFKTINQRRILKFVHE
jgi:hypothetical protein